MTLNSLYFLLVFLPIALILYHLVPSPAKKPVLLVLSLVFCAWGNPIYLAVLLVSIGINYVFAKQMAKTAEDDEYDEDDEINGRLLLLFAAIAVNVAILVLCRYLPLLLSFTFIGQLPAAIGISFYTLSVIGYLVDLYRKEDTICGLLDYAVFLTFFPKFIAGPVLRRSEFVPKSETLNLEMLGMGLNRLIIGLAKKAILAQLLARAITALTGAGTLTFVSAWLTAILLILELYFDFSGYFDMAAGLSEMLGYHFADNFNIPFAAAGFTDFLGRWATSVTGWFRGYIYDSIVPDENEAGHGRKIIAFAVIAVAAALWHQFSLALLLWGVWLFLMLFAEHMLGEHWNVVPKVLRVIINDICLLIGGVLLLSGDALTALRRLGGMIGIGTTGFSDAITRSCFVHSLPLLIICVICCTPLLKALQTALVFRRKGNIPMIVNIVLYAVLLVLCIVMLSSGAEPFIYAQF